LSEALRAGESPASRAPSDAELASRLTRLAGLRLGVLTVFLAVLALVYLRGQAPDGFSAQVAFVAVASAYGLAGLYVWLLRSQVALRTVAQLQLVTDQLGWTAFVYVSGGITSGATSLYGLSCLSGAIVLGLRGGLVAYGAAATSYIALGLGFALDLVPTPPDQNPAAYMTELRGMGFPLVANLAALALVTGLAAYLAERLRTTDTSLAEANARAEEAEKLAVLGRVAAGLAHEIRNPLGAIAGSIELLRESPALGTEDRELCELVRRETERLDALVSDMLELARPRTLSLERFDAAAVAREVATLASRTGRGADVALVVGGGASVRIEADPAQLRQLLWNLVRNAVQASAAESEVEVVVGHDGEDVVLEVRDRGPGIAPGARARIFDAFYSTRSKGTGIGLAVVRRIVEAHGWSIEVLDREGGGARFVVRAPSPKEAEEEARDAAKHPEAIGPSTDPPSA
jgi:two-component system, NtrC family, sensor histidine kinase HydH